MRVGNKAGYPLAVSIILALAGCCPREGYTRSEAELMVRDLALIAAKQDVTKKSVNYFMNADPDPDAGFTRELAAKGVHLTFVPGPWSDLTVQFEEVYNHYVEREFLDAETRERLAKKAHPGVPDPFKP